MITGDFYIGSTVNADKRKYYHYCDLRHNRHHSPILQNSWNKYGEKNFQFNVIENISACDICDVLTREQFYIDTLNPRFNICKIAGSPHGIKHTEQSCKNMSVAHLGHKLSNETIEKRRKKQSGENHWCYGKSRNNETKNKISLGLKEYYEHNTSKSKGTSISQDQRNKIAKKLMIPVLQYTKDMVFIKEWECGKTASQQLKIQPGAIAACCTGKLKSAGGFIWRHKT